MNEREIILRERNIAYEPFPIEAKRREEIYPPTVFFHTRVYEQFVTFCKECCQSRYIGIAYGPSGTGKTLAARTYAQWDNIEPLLRPYGLRMPPVGAQRLSFQTAFYTIERTKRPKSLEQDILMLQWSMLDLARRSYQVPQEDGVLLDLSLPDPWQLLILDNAHRLDAYTLDIIQDIYERVHIGIVLLGPFALVRRDSALSRHEHLRTRIGGFYPFRLLSVEEAHLLVEQFVGASGLAYDPKQGNSGEWLTAKLFEATVGNISMLRLFLMRIEKELEKKKKNTITPTLVDEVCHAMRCVGD
jgi:hypothetical protein